MRYLNGFNSEIKKTKITDDNVMEAIKLLEVDAFFKELYSVDVFKFYGEIHFYRPKPGFIDKVYIDTDLGGFSHSLYGDVISINANDYDMVGFILAHELNHFYQLCIKTCIKLEDNIPKIQKNNKDMSYEEYRCKPSEIDSFAVQILYMIYTNTNKGLMKTFIVDFITFLDVTTFNTVISKLKSFCSKLDSKRMNNCFDTFISYLNDHYYFLPELITKIGLDLDGDSLFEYVAS